MHSQLAPRISRILRIGRQRRQNTVLDEELVEAVVLRELGVERRHEVPALTERNNRAWVARIGVVLVVRDERLASGEQRRREAGDDLDGCGERSGVDACDDLVATLVSRIEEMGGYRHTGARMKTPGYGRFDSRKPSTMSGASNDSTCSQREADPLTVIQDTHTCEPQPLRIVVMSTPPRSSWPPFFTPSAACESKIAPAHVPHTGLFCTNSRSGSVRPASRASRAIVVDSIHV